MVFYKLKIHFLKAAVSLYKILGVFSSQLTVQACRRIGLVSF